MIPPGRRGGPAALFLMFLGFGELPAQDFSYAGIGIRTDLDSLAATLRVAVRSDRYIRLSEGEDGGGPMGSIEIGPTRVRLGFERTDDRGRPLYPACDEIARDLVLRYGEPDETRAFAEEAMQRSDRWWRGESEELALACFRSGGDLYAEAILIHPHPGRDAPIVASDAQRRLVAGLSGWDDARGQTVPFSRSTPEERAAAATYLVDALAEVGLSARLHEYRFPNINGLVDLLFPPYAGVNVFVEVPATVESEEVVVLGAHYDSERDSPGAVDNASGIALVWTVAQRIAELPARERDFIFVFFDQEEDDEVGSQAFVRFLERRGSKIHSVHVTDLAAWDAAGDGKVEIQSPPPDLERSYSREAARLGIPLEAIGGASSDNKSFMAAGMPAVGVFQAEIHPQLHRPSDTYDIVDFEYLARMTRLVGNVLEALAATR